MHPMSVGINNYIHNNKNCSAKQLPYGAVAWQLYMINVVCSYLIETKAVQSSTFPALFYLPLILSYDQPLEYGGNWTYADSKYLFVITRLVLSNANNEAPAHVGFKLLQRVLYS